MLSSKKIARRRRRTALVTQRHFRLAAAHRFTAPEWWPLNSPALNPVDYKVRGVLQERVCRTRILDVDDPKKRLIAAWSRLE